MARNSIESVRLTADGLEAMTLRLVEVGSESPKIALRANTQELEITYPDERAAVGADDPAASLHDLRLLANGAEMATVRLVETQSEAASAQFRLTTDGTVLKIVDSE